jgi:hypothetical protein
MIFFVTFRADILDVGDHEKKLFDHQIFLDVGVPGVHDMFSEAGYNSTSQNHYVSY